MAKPRSKTCDKRVRLHRSFKRSYREDYVRELEVPGMMHHIFATFKVIFKNWKLFLPLILMSAAMAVLFIGLMKESTYQQFKEILDQTSEELGVGKIGNFLKSGLLLTSTITSGGLSSENSETAPVFVALIFLIIWLTTIYFLRHKMAKHKVKFRDGIYNAMTPLISTFVILVIALIQCIPIFVLIIAYSAAVETEFLTMPFYALVFFIFAVLMILISGYLLSSTLIAMVAVSAPGLYPLIAMHAASDLMGSRRTKFVIRLIVLVLALIIMWAVVMIPLILFDLWMKQFEWTVGVPFIPVCLLLMTCFTGVYISAYMYLYYRWMLEA